jgi:hypothetical protein
LLPTSARIATVPDAASRFVYRAGVLWGQFFEFH